MNEKLDEARSLHNSHLAAKSIRGFRANIKEERQARLMQDKAIVHSCSNLQIKALEAWKAYYVYKKDKEHKRGVMEETI